MKKIISIALCLLMLLNLTGVTLNVSYCPMKHKTTYSFKKESCCCKKAKKEEDDNCCKNKKITITKSLDNYKQSSIPSIQKQLAFADIIPIQYDFECQVHLKSVVPQTTLIVKPPGRSLERTILYRQFLI